MLAEIAQGKSNAAIAESLFLTKRAVEKHINSIFLKLGLADAEDVSKRVKAALLLLADEAGGAGPTPAPSPAGSALEDLGLGRRELLVGQDASVPQLGQLGEPLHGVGRRRGGRRRGRRLLVGGSP